MHLKDVSHVALCAPKYYMVKENIGYDGSSPSISERYLCQTCHHSLLACETYFILCQHYLHLFESMIGSFWLEKFCRLALVDQSREQRLRWC